ncbi:subtilisin-like protein [Wilcoxina mikolae CBS 423.85]|nr:subtilisin-like protein [Wilcoxina mikolae CBS 423.85]
MAPETIILLLPELDDDILMYSNSSNRGNTILHLASEYNHVLHEALGGRAGQLELVKALVRHCPNLLKEINHSGHSAYLHRIHSFSELEQKEEGQYQWDRESAFIWSVDDSIAQYLKYEYMHLDSPIETIRFLHGHTQEREILLDLRELASMHYDISKQQISSLIGAIKFETILRYVRIPKFLSALDETDSTPKSLKGFWLIFELLWEKGVRKIIKIIVDDEEDSHSDDIIELLNRFDVEEWDWMKVDLCSKTICIAAPNVRKLSLYSSGNNAVLRSWSGNDGLNTLKQLKDVTVFVHQKRESRIGTRRNLDWVATGRTERNVHEFKKRMHKNCPGVSVVLEMQLDTLGEGDSSPFSTGDAEKFELNAWLNHMGHFASFLCNIPENIIRRTRPVKVAVIDDGIDMLDTQVNNSIAKGASFYTSRDTIRSYFLSSHGHGTLMAKLILRICPTAELYIARLGEADSFDGSKQLTAESAAKAIDWARCEGVDIICCPWIITVSEVNKADIDMLKPAIRHAHNEKILIFGATSDLVYDSNVQCYPGSMDEVFCIGSVRLGGLVEDATARESQFIFPVGDVRESKVGRNSASTNGNPQNAAKNSSATALAAGLAALILYCVDLVMRGHRDGLREHNAMMEIFRAMTYHDQPKYVNVKGLFIISHDLMWEFGGESEFRDMVRRIIRPYLDGRREY